MCIRIYNRLHCTKPTIKKIRYFYYFNWQFLIFALLLTLEWARFLPQKAMLSSCCCLYFILKPTPGYTVKYRDLFAVDQLNEHSSFGQAKPFISKKIQVQNLFQPKLYEPTGLRLLSHYSQCEYMT